MNPAERIQAYFDDCGHGTAADIASHFTTDAVIFDSNLPPVCGDQAIGQMWLKVRHRWMGASWVVDSVVAEGSVAAIEWSMKGVDPSDRRPFVFRGSEHYRFDAEGLIDEIRQYWTFDPATLDTGLIDYPYPDPGPD